MPKLCFKCKTTKSIGSYQRDSKAKDGRRQPCADCRGKKPSWGENFTINKSKNVQFEIHKIPVEIESERTDTHVPEGDLSVEINKGLDDHYKEDPHWSEVINERYNGVFWHLINERKGARLTIFQEPQLVFKAKTVEDCINQALQY